MNDPFTGDLQALQDANKRIAELEEHASRLEETIDDLTIIVHCREERIAELEEFVGWVAKVDDPPSRSLDVRIKQLVGLANEAKKLLEKGKQ